MQFVDDGNGNLSAIRLREVRVRRDPATGVREVVPVNDHVETMPADMVLLAIGFEGVEHMPLLDGLGLCIRRI